MDAIKKPVEQKPNPNDAFGPPDEDDNTDIVEPPPEKPATKPAEKPSPPAISASLRRTAKLYGISDDDIENSSPDQIQDAIAYLAEDRERARQAQPKAEPKAEIEEDDNAILEALDKELTLDPRLKKLLKNQILSRSNKEVKELKETIESLTKREQARLARAGDDAIDEGFESAGEEFKQVFGEGAASSLKKDSEEYQARVAVYRAAGVDVTTDSPAAIKRKIAKTAKALFGKWVKKAEENEDEAEENEDEKPSRSAYASRAAKKPAKKPHKGPDLGQVNGNVEWDEDAGTARPTNRTTKASPRSPKAAADAIRSYYQENGVPGGPNDDTFAGIPD